MPMFSARGITLFTIVLGMVSLVIANIIGFITGALFDIIANMTSLEVVSAAHNSFRGHIPTNIGKFQNLYDLMVSDNEISGIIPTSILNCSLLENLYVDDNKLRGELPPNIGLRLPHLVNFYVGSNQFTGTFPNSLLNLTNIEVIDLDGNNFAGRVPQNFGHLHNLMQLSLGLSHFEGDINFVGSLVNCTKLQILELGDNEFTGVLPESVANFSTSLLALELQNCGIKGHIPKHLSNLVSLRRLSLTENEFVGSIPYDLGKLGNLQYIDFSFNKLTSNIPESLKNISRLSNLYLNNNHLEGSIPPSLENCQNLLYLDLSQNHLNGALEFLKGSTMFVAIALSNNFLEGSIPQEIGNHINLVQFSASQNKLLGTIPDGLGNCLSLLGLDIHGNFFHGSIPTSFSALRGLQYVDLSKNNLSGTIPNYFSNFSQLEWLNLSYNNFEGEIPTTGVFANISAISLDENANLCGGIPKMHLPRCKILRKMNKRKKCAIKLIVFIICLLVGALIITTWLYLTCQRKKMVPTASGSVKESLIKVSYDMLLKSTNGFSSENLVGVGSFGSVFKGTLNGNTVVVKVLNLQTRGASKSFMAECKALRNIRHRNLVGIVTACSSIDHQGNDFKALIYEFMPNESLDGRLHGNEVKNITLCQRVDIAIDVGHALSYLHHDCEIPIVHCDLKPTNVLLDEEMVAHVGDFGLAKFLAYPQHPNQSSSIGVRGTVGYAAPEYGQGSEPCQKGDIYSYGILVLELMTGKRPTDNMFKEDYNLHSYAEAAFLADSVLEIVDPRLLVDNNEIGEEEADDIRTIQATNQRRFECMVSMISVGIVCSKHLPHDRMKISEAIITLQAARDNLCNGRRTAIMLQEANKMR